MGSFDQTLIYAALTVVIVSIFICVFLFVNKRFLAPERKRKGLLKKGKLARAVIIPGTMTQEAEDNNYYWMSFPVKVHPEEEESFVSRARHKLVKFSVSSYTVGVALKVRYNPNDHGMVAVESIIGLGDLTTSSSNITFASGGPIDLNQFLNGAGQADLEQLLDSVGIDLEQLSGFGVQADTKPKTSQASTEERLQQLKSLFEKGLITEEEYQRKKEEILSRL